MRVLVTGASGLLGANVVELFLDRGYEVNILIRKSSNTLGLNDLNPHVYYGDLNDKASIVEAAKNCTALVHCAANTKQWGTSREEHDRINLTGTKNMVEAAKQANVEKMVFVSTANTFPSLNQKGLPLQTDYVESKRAAENFVLNQDMVPAVIINPSFMIGARDVKPSSGQAILHYMNHNPVFAPRGGKSFIHVKDVAEAILNSVGLPVLGQRFLVANDNRSYQSFFDLIGDVTGQKKKIIALPPLLFNVMGELGTQWGRITGSAPKMTRENAHIINSDLFYDGESTYQELGVIKRPLEPAIEEAVSWFKKHGYC